MVPGSLRQDSNKGALLEGIPAPEDSRHSKRVIGGRRAGTYLHPDLFHRKVFPCSEWTKRGTAPSSPPVHHEQRGNDEAVLQNCSGIGAE